MVVSQNFRVADLSPEERRMVEGLLGKRLDDGASVVIGEAGHALGADADAAGSPQSWARFEAACDRVGKATVDLSDDEVDTLLGDRPQGWRQADAGRP